MLKIAQREFASTALTKGFIFGALVFPALIAVAMPFLGRLIQKAEESAPVVTGSMVLVDNSGSDGALAERVGVRLGAEEAGAVVPMSIADAQAQAQEQIENASEEEAREQAESMLATLTGRRSEITLEIADAGADLEAYREELRAAYTDQMTDEILAVAVVNETAVTEGEEGFGGFELIHRRKLDDRVVERMEAAVRSSIRDLRYDDAGLNRERLADLRRVPYDIQEVTESGDVQGSTAKAGIILPFVMLILLIMAVMTGGQYLLTTTVEEKNSRVVEVLLSAVSPMQLMFGKILGQLAVGGALLVIYSGLGIAAVTALGVASGLVTPMMLVLLGAYFLLAYVMVAGFMAAVGSAVNEMREAQSMMTPIAMLIMVPYFLVFPISRDPSSTMATVLSFIPPINPFVMAIRMGSTTPPPMEQHVLSLAIGVVGAIGMIWLAGKVFRVGLLMFGKPPNFKTLLRWVKMA